MNVYKTTLILIISMFALTNCMLVNDLDSFGRPPTFTPIDTEKKPETYKSPFSERPSSYEQSHPEQTTTYPQTLWAPGRRSFFRDQRAHKVGDILVVKVNISGEKAYMKNTSKRDRTNKASAKMPAFLGVTSTPIIHSGNALEFETKPEFSGNGEIDRTEDVNVQISVVVREILPSGNLVIEGRQEVRMNFEIREIYISGIVRHQDISNDNTIDWKNIAEARIGYGGRGQITQFQQPPYGSQFLDLLMPF